MQRVTNCVLIRDNEVLLLQNLAGIGGLHQAGKWSVVRL